jgi:streptomycin 6-kinase
MAVDHFEEFLATTRARLGRDAEPWVDDARRLLEGLVARWELELGEPYEGGSIGYAVRATRSGDRPVVLKITYPDAWFAEETAALLHWDGDGAVELLDHDPKGAQLLARVEPGTSLRWHEDEDEALGLAADVMERLWRPDPGGIATVGSEALEWARTMPARHSLMDRPFERALIHEAVELIRELVPTQREHVLLHGDLHLGNVLDAGDGRWVAVDPKPLIGERAFDVTALIRDKREDLLADVAAGRERVQARFDRLTERFDLERKRVRDWSVAIMVDYALWSFEAGDTTGGAIDAQVAGMLRDLRV